MYTSEFAAKLVGEIQRLGYGEFRDLYIPDTGICWVNSLSRPFKKLLEVIEEYQEIKCLKFQDGLPVLCEIEVETEVGKAIQKIKL